MNRKQKYLLFLFLTGLFLACEDTIDPDLENGAPLLVVDAWVNNLPQTQTIELSSTQPYFENQLPPPLSDAQVVISDNQGSIFRFFENEAVPGSYEWSPDDLNQNLGEIGTQYQLEVTANGETYRAFSQLKRVPEVDTVTFRFEPDDLFFPEDSFLAEFWARDPVGAGDTYWIKTYKNGVLLNKPIEINIAYDAGFSEGGNFDGTIFIQPIRAAVNPIDEDENDEILAPYEMGDSIFVEIHSINRQAFTYLNEVALQTDRQGGFAELFATPIANVSTNLFNQDPNKKNDAVGFFNVAAISGKGNKLQ